MLPFAVSYFEYELAKRFFGLFHTGSVLKATSAQKSWLVLNTSKEISPDQTSNIVFSDVWTLQQEKLDPNDFLVIASQTCDIKRSPTLEPYVEALRSYWTSERNIIH